MFMAFLGKMECKTQCLFCNVNNFLAAKIVLAKRAINDLCLPDTFGTRIDKRASANALPWKHKEKDKLE